MGLDSVLIGCGAAAEAILILLLLRVRLYRAFPAFLIYFCWSFVNDLYFFSLAFRKIKLSSSQYLHQYEISTAIDSIFMFVVLVELAWSILRPIRSSLPRYSWLAIVVLTLIAGAAVWFVAGVAVPADLPAEWQTLLRWRETGAILRVVVFLAMAGFSQLLSIGWRNRELQIATGFGFYSIVSLSVAIIHTHPIGSTLQYHLLDDAEGVSYVFALSYWVFAFATREAERREFTPQMQNFLLAAAGSARAARIGIANSSTVNQRKNKD